jgi:hypothetical protein
MKTTIARPVGGTRAPAPVAGSMYWDEAVHPKSQDGAHAVNSNSNSR